MPFFSAPKAFRLANNPYSPLSKHYAFDSASITSSGVLDVQNPFQTFRNEALPPHSSHPPFGHLILLVFEAVLEVVCVSFPGYIVARQGMFNAEMQKFAANLNVMLFTPCLIFTKLASQLTADKLGELAVIPVIFALQTLVSFLCALTVAKLFRFKKRPRNFVIAMGVFGNSNSLPISLVISLSQTIRGLHWDKLPGDNDDEVAARGILYLLIFQQLGQLVRWSWGYHVLLAPPDKFRDEDAHENSLLEQGIEPYSDTTHEEGGRLIDDSPSRASGADGETTPITHQQYTSSLSSNASSHQQKRSEPHDPPSLLPTPANGNVAPAMVGKHTTSPLRKKSADSGPDNIRALGSRGLFGRCNSAAATCGQGLLHAVRSGTHSLFYSLPCPLQACMRHVASALGKFSAGVWEFMNPPLWAMLAAIIVASIPSLQRLFFSEGTFVKNSITSAIRQMGGVAVPLILVVLGANLEGKTQPTDPNHSEEDDKEETKLLIASVISRMLLPIVIMAPLLALAAKYVPVSILDDPIFVIVCFLLTGAPSALQLAQICQINGVYLGAMSRLLFQSYVVWILPSTLVLVLCSIEVLEWAA
ncbi:MAG: hypothetical protein LQ348_007141 [Seirophora lacunosa]|nr:MAG: hypothetical protein LQ348_007141 [Seirophora lacunosa]